jgi:hypothetical protein
MSHDDPFDWRMPDGESLLSFLERHAAAEARQGPRFASFDASAAPETDEWLLRCQAAFLVRYPHYAPRRLPQFTIDVFATWEQWQTFLAWACHEAGMTQDFAQRLRLALTWVARLDVGGPELPRTYN